MFNSIKPDQNPQTSLIQQCLANYDYSNATVLAEDLLLKHDSEENKGLLADCYLFQQENIKAYFLLKICTSPMNLYKLAVASLRLGKLAEAESALLRGKEVPNGVHGIELLGTIYKKQGKGREARETYRKALQKNPNLLATKKKLHKLTVGFERFETKNEAIQEDIPSLFGKHIVPMQNTAGNTGLFERRFASGEGLFASNNSQQSQSNNNGEPKDPIVDILTEIFMKEGLQAEQEKKQSGLFGVLPAFGTRNLSQWKSTAVQSDGDKGYEVVDFASEGNEKKDSSPILVVEEDSSVIRKNIKKGKNAEEVDMYFDEEDCEVYTGEDGKFYSKILNQTNIKMNNNKFYIAQILESTKIRGTFFFWTRWGRVGVQGQWNKLRPANLEEAIRLFEQKVYDKTVKGNYIVIEMDYGEEKEDLKEVKNEEKSKLPEPVQDLVKLIFDVKMLADSLKEVGYDANKLPVGKISGVHIRKGYETLKEISDAIERQRPREIFAQYSADFYTLIPHNFGFQKMSNFVIDTAMKVKQKLELLNSLENIRIASSILANPDNKIHPLDHYYHKLNCAVSHCLPDSEDFALIAEYLQNTHISTHSAFTLELLDVFSVERHGEAETYRKDLGNKQLLWFGSRLNNYAGILAQGLKLPPAEAPENGYMFGKGVYFADMASKAANYCFVNPGGNVGILMLCEVALGECSEKLEADFGGNNLPVGKYSVKGVGRSEPAASGSKVIGDEVMVPMGKPENKNIAGKVSLLYNEYVVYDVNQIKVRYLVKVKFNSKFNSLIGELYRPT